MHNVSASVEDIRSARLRLRPPVEKSEPSLSTMSDEEVRQMHARLVNRSFLGFAGTPSQGHA